MLEMMSGLLGAPSERIWPGWGELPLAGSFRLPTQPYNYLRKVGGCRAQQPPCRRATARRAAACRAFCGLATAPLRLRRHTEGRTCTAHDVQARAPLPLRTPSLQEFPSLSDAGVDLLNRLLTYDPERRITARQALRHPYFSGRPLPAPTPTRKAPGCAAHGHALPPPYRLLAPS